MNDSAKTAFLKDPSNEAIAIEYHKCSMDSGKLTEAKIHFRNAISQYPDRKRLYHLYISLLLQLGDYQEAMIFIEDTFLRFGIEPEMVEPALTVRRMIGPFSKLCKSKKSNQTISLCMIVKNDMQSIVGALASVKPIVHEMVVVDTGSFDLTRSMAEIFGARVFEFSWTGNFSDARNFAMEKARGGWILSLDSDETVSSKDYKKFRTLIRDHEKSTVAFSFITRNYTWRSNIMGWQVNDHSYPQEKGLGWYPSEKVRLYPNKSSFKFEFQIHEKVEPSLRRHKVPINPSGVFIHHYGPLDEKKLSEKGKIYLHMGYGKLGQTNQDYASLREVAVQLSHLEQWREAESFWKKLILMNPDIPESYLNLGTVCWHLGEYDRALESAKEAVRLDPSVMEGHFNMGMAYLFLGESEKACALFRETLRRKETYVPGQFMMSISLACTGEMKRAKTIMSQLSSSPLKNALPFSLTDVINRFHEGGWTCLMTSVINLALSCDIPLPNTFSDK